MFRRYLAIGIVLLLAFGCTGIKPTSSKANSKFYETFYVGDDGLQYFIKPLEFTASKSEQIFMDFTFRYKRGVNSMATINFTQFSQVNLQQIDSIEINSLAKSMLVKQVSHMFTEKEKDGVSSRFTFQIPLRDLNALFSDVNWSVAILGETFEQNYKPEDKSRKIMKGLKSQIFDLIQE